MKNYSRSGSTTKREVNRCQSSKSVARTKHCDSWEFFLPKSIENKLECWCSGNEFEENISRERQTIFSNVENRARQLSEKLRIRGSMPLHIMSISRAFRIAELQRERWKIISNYKAKYLQLAEKRNRDALLRQTLHFAGFRTRTELLHSNR